MKETGKISKSILGWYWFILVILVKIAWYWYIRVVLDWSGLILNDLERLISIDQNHQIMDQSIIFTFWNIPKILPSWPFQKCHILDCSRIFTSWMIQEFPHIIHWSTIHIRDHSIIFTFYLTLWRSEWSISHAPTTNKNIGGTYDQPP